MRGHLTLGSNLGDPAQQIDAALSALADRGVQVIARSSLYNTEPVGAVLDQPVFLNAAAAIETDLEPEALLAVLKDIERDAGRENDRTAPGYVPDGPRAIDLDIALLDGVARDTEHLTVPHPRLLERRFALIPLLELDDDLTTPDGARLADALAALPIKGQDVRRVMS